MATKYLEAYRLSNGSKAVPSNFIEENTGLLHTIARVIFAKNVTMADYDDIYMDCVLAVYDVFEGSLKADLSSIKNEVSYIAQAVHFIALKTLWDFHRGASISYNTMKANRRNGNFFEDAVSLSAPAGGDSGDGDAKDSIELHIASQNMSPEDVYIQKEMLEQIKVALSALEGCEREAIVTIYLGNDKNSLDKASEILNRPRSTVNFQKERGMKQIRHSLGLDRNEAGRYFVK